MTDQERLATIALIVGGGLMTVGSFMPWATISTAFGSVSKTGLEGDGRYTLVAGLAIAGVGVALLANMLQPMGWSTTAALVAGLIGLGIAWTDGRDAAERIADLSNDFVYARVGAGIWVVGIGGAVCIASGVFSANLQNVLARPSDPNQGSAGQQRPDEIEAVDEGSER